MSPRWPTLALLACLGGLVAWAASGGAEAVTGDDATASGSAASTTARLPVMPATEARSSTWYCAAGLPGEDEVVITNTTADPVDGTVTVVAGGADSEAPRRGAGQQQPDANQQLTVPGHGQLRVRPAELVAASGSPVPTGDASLLATVIEMDGGGVAVEHEIADAHGRVGGTCASGAASEWHFAWGVTTRDAQELLVLFNPFPSDVKVDAVFSTPGEIREPVRWQGMTVPARQVVAVDVGEDVTRRSQVAASVRARDGLLVVERWQVFDGSVDAAGATATLGQPAPAEAWMFTHGVVDAGLDEQIVVYNPTADTAEVDVAVLPVGDDQGDGDEPPPEPFGLVVRPGRFAVLDYGDESRITPGIAHTTVVTSSNGVPVVAERVLSSTRSELRGVSAAPGSFTAAPVWTFPVGLGDAAAVSGEEGSTDEGAGEPSATSRYVARYVVVNPDPQRSAKASLTLYGDGQTTTPPQLHDVELAPGGRAELAPSEDAGPYAVADTSVVVHADSPIVVERVISVDGIDVTASPGIPSAQGLETLRPDR